VTDCAHRVGKSRLALLAGRALETDFDAVWVAGLQSITIRLQKAILTVR
jgi:hypothetical protein